MAASAGLTVARRFGENLRRVRQGAGLSQETLGFASGLHRTEIGLLERGARVPRIDTLIKIASALGVKVDCPLCEGISWEGGETTTKPGAFDFSSPDDEASSDASAVEEDLARG